MCLETGRKWPTGIPDAVNGLVAAPINSPSSGATMSTVRPGVAGSEMVAITSPSLITEPAVTNISSNPPSPALSHLEPLASILNLGLLGVPGTILRDLSTFKTP